MSLSSFQFQPQLLPTLVAALLVPVFLGLGLWQLDRAEQKKALDGIQKLRAGLPELTLTGDPLAADQAEYRTIAASGTFLPAKTILLENRKYRGKTGFHVVTPLRIGSSERYLLVNRGWIPASRDGTSPSFPTPEGPVEIKGEATVPLPRALRLDRGEDELLQRSWPYLTLEDYTKWSGLKLYPFLLLQAKSDEQGFARAWTRSPPNQGMHIGYALQWFAFAAITAALWLRLSISRSSQSGQAADG